MANYYRQLITKLDDLVKSRFIEMFGTMDQPKVPFKELGDVATYVNGFAFKPTDWRTEGLPIIRIQNLSGSGDSFNYYSGEYPQDIEINKGDIMISWSATLGVFVWNGPKALLNQHIFKVYFDKMDVNPTYFRVAVESALKMSASKVHGSTMTHLTKKTFDAIKIAMPTIEQQNEFAAFVEQVDKSKVIAQKAAEKYEQLVKSRFIEMNKKNQQIDRLGNHIQTYSAKRANDKKYPILSITKEYGIVLQEEKFKKRIASADTTDYKIVPKGTLVQGIHIDERNFGIQDIVDAGIVSPAYKLWTVNREKSNPDFIAYAMRSDEFAKYIQSKFRGSIRRRENVTTDDILNAPINIPSLKVQNDFVSFMKKVEKTKFKVTKEENQCQ